MAHATLLRSARSHYYSECRRRLYFIDKGDDVLHVCMSMIPCRLVFLPNGTFLRTSLQLLVRKQDFLVSSQSSQLFPIQEGASVLCLIIKQGWNEQSDPNRVAWAEIAIDLSVVGRQFKEFSFGEGPEGLKCLYFDLFCDCKRRWRCWLNNHYYRMFVI